MIWNFWQFTVVQGIILRFLRHLLLILSQPQTSIFTGRLINKVRSDLDFYLPFRQYGPSLVNARHVIYTNVEHFTQNDGIAFFNVLAFHGVFFGSPFARSAHYRWFDSLNAWKIFRAIHMNEAAKFGGDDKYYINKSCYGRPQKDRELELLSTYWDQRLEWNEKFNGAVKPSIDEVFKWLKNKKNGVKMFPNIGGLTVLLICGDLVEAGILSIPSVEEWAGIVYRLGKGAKDGMEVFGLTQKTSSQQEVQEAFVSLHQVLQSQLGMEEKAMMGYDIIMLEHTLCKIKRLVGRAVSKDVILSEI